MSYNETGSVAFQEGYKAFKEGVNLLDNPYDVKNKYWAEWSDWAAGWEEAERKGEKYVS